MNSIVCVLSLIIGCFGQQDIVSTSLNLNSALTPLQNGISSLVNGVMGLSRSNGIPNSPQIPAIPISTAPEVFERPCRLSDLGCIRRYFLHHSKCKQPPGRVPDPLTRPLSNKFYPRFNMTEIDVNAVYSGLNNGRIQEFYINRNTDKLVIGIELRDYVNACNDTFFIYHRRGREPIITHGSANVLFRSVYMTVIIPQVENLRLEKSDSFVVSNDPQRIMNLEPSLGQSSDPTVAVALADFQANEPMVVSQYFFSDGSFLAATYIQYVICDFGLQLV